MTPNKSKNHINSFLNNQIEPNPFPSISLNKKKLNKILSSHPTPLFVTDRAIINYQFNSIDQALNQHWGENHAVAYSLKTNYHLIKPIKKLGAWAEVVSDHELKLAYQHQFSPQSIIYNGPLKSKTSLIKSLSHKSIVNVDNFQELNTILSLRNKIKKIEICLRLNPYKHDYRFGFPIDSQTTLKTVNLIQETKQIKLVGFHTHLGSDINKLSIYSFAATAIAHFINSLDRELVSSIKYLDIGGGFPSSGLKPYYYKKWQPEPISNYIKIISKIIKPIFSQQNLPKLITEPGRYLTDDSTIFITKIINLKHTPRGQVLTTNGAITMLPLIYYRPQIVKLYSHKLSLKQSFLQKSLVYGSTCKQDDILYQKPLPAAKINDYLIFFCTGAYNLNLSPDFIFNKPKTYFIN